MSKEQYQKRANVLQRLEQGLQNLFDSEKFKNYLKFLHQFRQYSLRNTILIYSQYPTATFVAPYRQWQKMHRHVKKGEKGICIFAPHTYKRQSADNTADEIQLGFHLAYTYDISQTDADNEHGELPENICQNLAGNLADASLLSTLSDISPVPVSFEQISGSANGYFSPTDLKIVVDNSNSQIQQAKTLLHEMSHAWHHALIENFDKCSHADQETVAEASAYIVCNFLGIDSSEYSFPYLATWSKEHNLKEFQANLSLIKKISDQIIGDIETRLDASITI